VIRFAIGARHSLRAGRWLSVIAIGHEAAVSDTTPMPCPHGGWMVDDGGRSPASVFRTLIGHERGVPRELLAVFG
jgi:hypothetical protein